MSRSATAAIIDVATQLGDALDEVVFLGGAVVPLLVTDPGAFGVRPTDDVDVIVEVASRHEYNVWEATLRARGFRNDTSEGAPICRWLLGSVRVDVMPTDPDILGFSNRWYPYALRTATRYPLDPQLSIQLISPVAFLATKIEAFRSPHRRFSGDFRASHDLEDVIAVFEGRPEVDEEIASSESDVRIYLIEIFQRFLADSNFRDALPGHLEPGPTNAARSRMLLKRLEQLATL